MATPDVIVSAVAMLLFGSVSARLAATLLTLIEKVFDTVSFPSVAFTLTE